MKEKLFYAIVVGILMIGEMFPGLAAQDVSKKAEELLNQARAALGGEKFDSIKSLSATGKYRRMLGDREMSGEIQFDILLPDKILRSETMNPVPSVEVTRIEAINGGTVWTDQQTSGGGMVVIRRPGGDTPEGQERQNNSIRAEFARMTLGWLLSTPSSFPVEYRFAGEAEAPDGKADVLEIKGPNGFSSYLFIDQKTHKPLMLSYKGRKPRMVMRSFSGSPGNHEDLEKRIKEAEAEEARQPEVEYQIRFSDYREVNGISFPHLMSRSIDGEVNEELEITKFKVNPQMKPEKFVKN